MNWLLFSSVLFGAFVVAARGPVIFAPEPIFSYYRDHVFTTRTAAAGVMLPMLAVGLLMIATTPPNAASTFALVVRWVGLLLVVGSLLALAFPALARNMLGSAWSRFGAAGMRAVGIVSVLLAVVWIYLSVRYLA